MAGVSVEIKGLKEALAQLRKSQSAVGLPDVVGNVLAGGVRKQFIKGEDPDTGEKWKPIKNREGQPLRDSGRLMRTIHPEKSGEGFKSTVYIGTNLIYGATHQYGDPHRVPKTAPRLVFTVMGVTVFAKKVSIPQRKFLPTTDAGTKVIAKGLEEAVQLLIQKAWDGK
jgi:phage gpG-like protein